MSQIDLGEETTSEVEVLRIGTIQDRGLKISKKMLDNFVENFQSNVYGTEIQVNLEHKRGSEAAGWVKDLFIKGQKLFAKVEWTELGVEKVKKNLFKFVSAELAGIFPHHKTGDEVKDVFIGLALTNTPALKAQHPLALSEQLTNLLTETSMLKKFISKLKERNIVSKSDKELLKELLDEATEEVKTEVAEDVAEVEAKPEVAEKTEEEKKAEEDAKTAEEKVAEEAKVEAEALKEKLKDAEKLAEEVLNQKAKIEILEEEKLEREMNDEAEAFMLSEENKIGFPAGKKDDVVSLLKGMSAEQRVTLKTLLSEIQAADLKKVGSTDTSDLSGKEVTELAEQFLKEKKATNITEAQKMAEAELAKK